MTIRHMAQAGCLCPSTCIERVRQCQAWGAKSSYLICFRRMSDSVEQCSAVAIRSSHRYRSPEQVEEKAAVVRVEPRALVVCGAGIVLLVVAFIIIATSGAPGGDGGAAKTPPAGPASEIVAGKQASSVPPLPSDGCSGSQLERGGVTNSAVPGDTDSFTLSVDGVDRTFRVHLPTTYLAMTDPLPLVFNFHGWGSSGRGQERLTHMSDLADALPGNASFIAVYPDALGDLNAEAMANVGYTRAWNGGGCNSSPVCLRACRVSHSWPSSWHARMLTGVVCAAGPRW